MSPSATAVVIVAAGSGQRLGAAVPKAFVPLNGVTLLERAVATAMTVASHVVIVVPTSYVDEAEAIAARLLSTTAPDRLDVRVVAGGLSRGASVESGLAALDDLPGNGVVLVHDAARALAPATLFAQVAHAVSQQPAVGIVPVLSVVDAIKRVDEQGRVREAVDRTDLRRAQTPQGFTLSALRAAYATVRASDPGAIDHHDDAQVFSRAGGEVYTIAGDDRAEKITTPADLAAAARRLQGQGSSQIEQLGNAVGTGVDAHAFSDDPAAALWLAGLHWPTERGLAGHSDGDVVAHALVDAMLGAAGLGDIGGMFGVDDPAFAGARGERFVREARARIEQAGWHIVNASIEVVGNRPRLSARRAEAEALLERWLAAPVNLAATTTDGLGLTGEGRGIGAIATVLLARLG